MCIGKELPLYVVVTVYVLSLPDFVVTWYVRLLFSVPNVKPVRAVSL